MNNSGVSNLFLLTNKIRTHAFRKASFGKRASSGQFYGQALIENAEFRIKVTP